MPITIPTFFQMRGVRNLDDQIREVQVYSILVMPFSCILARALFNIKNYGHPINFLELNKFMFTI